MSQLHQIALTLLPNIGPATAKAMLNYCGSPEAVFSTSKSSLLRIPGIGPKTANALRNDAETFARAEQELAFAEKEGIEMIFYTDTAYPRRLKSCIDGPVMIYKKGSADLNAAKIVSIVGTRNSTDYGHELCDSLVRGLAGRNVAIVSGMAYGIDVAAHKACLQYGVPTIAVLGHGLDRLYPRVHQPVARKMLAQGGALISDFTSGTEPNRENFPRRNRIIAGLADATVVVEAALKGGALITAEIARSYNREVFAFPGPVGSLFSEGCNQIIRTNRAALITSAGDLVDELGWADCGRKDDHVQMNMPFDLTDDEKRVMDTLARPLPASVDDLVVHTGLLPGSLAAVLLSLEMQGLILSLPGKTYRKKS